MDNPNEPIFKVPPTDPMAEQPHKSWFARHILAEILALVFVMAVGAAGYYWQVSKSDSQYTPVHQTKPDDCPDTPSGPSSLCGGQIISSYASCVAAGNPISKSKPPKCTTSDGITFVEPVGVCIQVIQTARNPKTGVVRDFATPCDVPEGWEKT